MIGEAFRSSLARLLQGASNGSSHYEQRLTFKVSQADGSRFFDGLEIDPTGLIRIHGWSRREDGALPPPDVRVGENSIPFLHVFRVPRPDVGELSRDGLTDSGLVWEYLTPPEGTLSEGSLQITMSPGNIVGFDLATVAVDPHYRELFQTDRVLHRADVYGSGPPNKAVHPEVLRLTHRLHGKILDFGCGRGILLEDLRKRGMEAYGVELDSDWMRSFTPPQVQQWITYYDGTSPLPFADGEFESVICSEVLEHIPDYQSAVSEIARLATRRAVFTVPDASAIPLGYRHGAVPWHLMEGTHVNFFCQRSLQVLLQPWFRKIEFGRIGNAAFNDTNYYVSLVAVCDK